MRKKYKSINIALIFTLLGWLFCQNLVYSCSISYLRVPLLSNDEIGKKRQEIAQIVALFLAQEAEFRSNPERLIEFLSKEQIKVDEAFLDLAEPYIEEALQIKEKDKESYLDSIISPTIPPAVGDKISKLFDDDFEPGTFMVSERLNSPSFLTEKDRIPLRDWIHLQVRSALERIKKSGYLSDKDLEKVLQKYGIPLEDLVFLTLYLRFQDGHMLMEVIPNQIFQDVFNRIIAFFLYGDPYMFPYIGEDYNQKIGGVAFAILPKIKDLSLKEIFSYSVAAGALGLDLKSTASAASFIRDTNIIRFYIDGESEEARFLRMFESLKEKSEREFAIDFWDEFETQIVASSKEIQVTFFHDDYAETIFDLLFVQKLLEQNPLLRVISVPRSAHYGNDASYSDVMEFLNNPIFSQLKQFIDEGRYVVSSQGPGCGAVVGLEFSEEVADAVLQSEVIIVKGSRSYEMLQGIRKDGYYASMVCREFSESVTGIDSNTGLSVLIKQYAGLPSFQGFRQRHTRNIPLYDTGSKGWVTLMTAREYTEAVRSLQYRQILDSFEGDREMANKWIRENAEKQGVTIAGFIKNYTPMHDEQVEIQNFLPEQVALDAKVIAIDLGGTLTPADNPNLIQLDDFLEQCLLAIDMLLLADDELQVHIISRGRVPMDEILGLFPRFAMLRSRRFHVSELVGNKRERVEQIIREAGLPETSVIAIGDDEEIDGPMALAEGHFIKVYPHTWPIRPTALDILSRILEIKGKTRFARGTDKTSVTTEKMMPFVTLTDRRPRPKIQLAVLDWDGTVVKTPNVVENILEQIWHKMVNETDSALLKDGEFIAKGVTLIYQTAGKTGLYRIEKLRELLIERHGEQGVLTAQSSAEYCHNWTHAFQDEFERQISECFATAEDVMVPGIRKLLEVLSDRGIPIVIASATWTGILDKEIEWAGIGNFVKATFSAGSGLPGDFMVASKAEAITLARRMFGDISQEATVMIGDSATDGFGAQEGGVLFVGISDNPERRIELGEYADALINGDYDEAREPLHTWLFGEGESLDEAVEATTLSAEPVEQASTAAGTIKAEELRPTSELIGERPDREKLNEKLLLFYTGEIPDHRGRFIYNIWEFSHEQLEDEHDYIQLLFPDTQVGMFFGLWVSGVDRDKIVVPKILKGDADLLQESDEISARFKANMLRSLDLMLDFYGFQYSLKDDEVIIEPSPAFEERQKNWITPGDHNFLRITRILGSLRWSGLEEYAMAFLDALTKVYEIKKYKSIIDESDSFSYWKSRLEDLGPHKTLTITRFISDRRHVFSSKTPLSETLRDALVKYFQIHIEDLRPSLQSQRDL